MTAYPSNEHKSLRTRAGEQWNQFTQPLIACNQRPAPAPGGIWRLRDEEEDLPGEGAVGPLGDGGTRRYSGHDIDRHAQICALAADGLNLAGTRRVLQMHEETRQLQAELARLREQLAGGPPPGGSEAGCL